MAARYRADKRQHSAPDRTAQSISRFRTIRTQSDSLRGNNLRTRRSATLSPTARTNSMPSRRSSTECSMLSTPYLDGPTVQPRTSAPVGAVAAAEPQSPEEKGLKQDDTTGTGIH